MSEENKKEWQQRTELLLGEEKMERLRKAHVLVVGLGGVGAYAAEMICRAGVGRMTIVDADTVQPSNINRQLPATHSVIGRPKAEVLAERTHADVVQVIGKKIVLYKEGKDNKKKIVLPEK